MKIDHWKPYMAEEIELEMRLLLDAIFKHGRLKLEDLAKDGLNERELALVNHWLVRELEMLVRLRILQA